MKLYTVQRTVVFTVDVEASNEQEALEFTNGMGGGAFDAEELVEESVISISELVPA